MAEPFYSDLTAFAAVFLAASALRQSLAALSAGRLHQVRTGLRERISCGINSVILSVLAFTLCLPRLNPFLFVR